MPDRASHRASHRADRRAHRGKQEGESAMKTIPLCTTDIRKIVQSAAKPKNFDLPKNMVFQVGLEVDDALHKKIETDAKLAAGIFGQVSKEYKETVKKITNLTKFADRQMLVNDRKKVAKQWQATTDRYFAEAADRMFKLANKEIEDWKKTRKDRTSYTVKSTLKITVGTLGVATATLGTVVAAAAGGPGVIVALVGLAKAMVNLGKEIYALQQKMEKAEKSLKKHLDKLIASYKDATKRKVARKELLAAAFKQITTVNKVSISVCEAEYASFHGKLAGINIRASKAGQKLHRMLDLQEALDQKILSKVSRELKQVGYKSKKLPKLESRMKKLIKTTKSQVADMEALYKRVDDANKRDKNHKQALKLLKDKKPGWVKYAEASMKLIDLAVSAGFTDFTQAAQILVLVDSIGVEIDDLLVEQL